MMTESHRSFLIREQLIAPALFNFAINATIAWFVFRTRGSVPVWGGAGLTPDTVATLFLLPFLTCLIVTPLVKRSARAGKVAPLPGFAARNPWLSWLPASVWGRAAALGAVSVLVGLPLIQGGLSVLGIAELHYQWVVVLKGFYTAILAAIIGPAIALTALSESPAPQPAT